MLGGAYVTGAEEAPCAPLFVGEGGAGDDDSVLEAKEDEGSCLCFVMVMMMMLKAGIRGAPPLPSVHVRPQPFTEVFAPAAHYSGPPPSQPKLARTSTILFHFLSSKSAFQKVLHQQPTTPALLANPSLQALEQFHFIEVLKNQPFTELFAPAATSLPYPSSHALKQYYFCFRNKPFKKNCTSSPPLTLLVNPSSHALQQYSF